MVILILTSTIITVIISVIIISKLTVIISITVIIVILRLFWLQCFYRQTDAIAFYVNRNNLCFDNITYSKHIRWMLTAVAKLAAM